MVAIWMIYQRVRECNSIRQRIQQQIRRNDKVDKRWRCLSNSIFVLLRPSASFVLQVWLNYKFVWQPSELWTRALRSNSIWPNNLRRFLKSWREMALPTEPSTFIRHFVNLRIFFQVKQANEKAIYLQKQLKWLLQEAPPERAPWRRISLPCN